MTEQRLSWWCLPSREEFMREAAKRAITMRQEETKDTKFSLNLRRKPKPEGNRASVQTEAA